MIVAFVTTDNRQDTRQYNRPVPWFGTAPEALLQGFAEQPDLTVHVVSCAQQRMNSPKLLATNIHFHSLHVPKIGWLRTGYQGCVRACRKKIREINPDIVHGQGTERDCALSAVFSGYPNVLTIHGNMRLISRVNRAKPFSYEWLAARLERFALPRSDGVVCITRYTQAAVADLARRTWVAPNAVDQSFFEITPQRSDPPAILCVGVISPRKNQNSFIAALDPLAARHRFRAIFLGGAPPGEYADEFRRLVAARSWCEHVGFSGRDRVREEFGRASILALPSREDNCPMAVLEAMAAQLPVVAANVGGVPDLIEPNVTGLFCDPLNPESMRGAVERLLVDRPFAEQLARQARQSALARFHPRVIAAKHLEIYREVLGRRS
jgi:glycosyltransferase involved in cell wall biosynthesis